MVGCLKEKKKRRRVSCLASLGGKLVAELHHLLEKVGGRNLKGRRRLGWILVLVDGRPHNVRDKKRNTIEDQEVYKLQEV